MAIINNKEKNIRGAKMKSIFKHFSLSAVLILLMTLMSSSAPYAATNDDYAATPAFISGAAVTPNLLLMIDNSGSMYDLTYVDEGTAVRDSSYCYDNTYSNQNTYAGYFETGNCTIVTATTCNTNADCITLTNPGDSCDRTYYEYIPGNARFEEYVGPDPLPCTKDIVDTLCINLAGGPPSSVTDFIASGNYLNWLTASKLDVEKAILTGGKYDTANTELVPESRGCVGRNFIKESLISDYVEGAVPAALGITFGISGPEHPNNPTGISIGGQTYIKIFDGAYDALGLCKTAIDMFNDPNAQKQALTVAIEECLNIGKANQKQCQFDTRIPPPKCNNDADCFITAGTCSAGGAGACDTMNTIGTCGGVTTPGVCTADNGICDALCVGGKDAGSTCTKDADCRQGICTPSCAGGGRDGAACNINADCEVSMCIAGTVGDTCTVNSDCDLKECTAGKVGPPASACSVNSDCDIMECGSGNVGAICEIDADCSTNTCSAGLVGNSCVVNSDCDVDYGACLAPATTQIHSTFIQSVHSCYQYIFKGQDINANDINQVSNPAGCNMIYRDYYTCVGGTNDDRVCTGPADCPGGVCDNGPDSISPGSPVLLCSERYAGYCAEEISPPDWSDTNWVARAYADADECVTVKYREYCAGFGFPEVIDPTLTPDDPAETAGLPAIIGDLSLVSQLGNPIETYRARIEELTAPTGLIQEYATRIRMGVMSFNYDGSATECGTVLFSAECPKVCSNDADQTCTTIADCPDPLAGVTCNSATNKDGTIINHYIGEDGTCSISGGSCMRDDQCPTIADDCVPSVGDHTTGLIYKIDEIRADTWTPFAEGFYNTVAYFVKDADNNPNLQSYCSNATSVPCTPATIVPDCVAVPTPGVSCVTPFTETDALVYEPLNTSDIDDDKNPIEYRCQVNNVLLISDGAPTADVNTTMTSLYGSAVGEFTDFDGACSVTTSTTCVVDADCPVTETCNPVNIDSATCGSYLGSTYIDDIAYTSFNSNIFDATDTDNTNDDVAQKIFTHVVYSGTQSSTETGECNPATLMEHTAKSGGTNNAKMPTNPEELRAALKASFDAIAAVAASGTAASVLASGEGSGANLVQAVFFPERSFDDGRRAEWLGSIQNLWYFVDPRFARSGVREDTVRDSILNLKEDYVAQFYFDSIDKKTKSLRFWDEDGDYDPLPIYQDTVDFEQLKSIWNAGYLLWNRNLSTTPRTIKTNISGTLIDFSITVPATVTAIKPYLQAGSDAEASSIIQWIHGFDANCSGNTTRVCSTDADCEGAEVCTLGGYPSSYRSRTVAIDLDRDGDVTGLATDPGAFGISESPKVWKLGDIVNSTPKVVSWVAQNTYDLAFKDKTYTKFVTTSDYKSRGLVFTGANDGVLHAFKMGTLQLKEDPAWAQNDFDQARLLNYDEAGVPPCSAGDTVRCGDEVWAFVPKNVLPYLKYMTDPNYLHLYTVDATPVIFDASIGAANALEKAADGSSWRTVLIGAMRLGGASKGLNNGCSELTDCVKAPWIDINNNGAFNAGEDLVGLSSYFAIDITDPLPQNWTLLWEFTNEGLGYTTAGPSAMKINPAICKDSGGNDLLPKSRCNGKWFVVIPSGSTGPIDTVAHQYLGRSDQNLKLFVLDLKTGNLARTIDTGIANAFGGYAITSSLDPDFDYQDDAMYIGFAKKCVGQPKDQDLELICDENAPSKWTNGGVLRLTTAFDPDGSGGPLPKTEDPNPNNWEWSYVIDDIGPVITSIDRLENSKTKKLWLFFGAGRYFYKRESELDDYGSQRKIFGIKDPCYVSGELTSSCQKGLADRSDDEVDEADLLNVTLDASASEDAEGWYLDLEGDDVPIAGYGAERVVTNPVATTSGYVFFTTFKPTADVCGYGGNTYLWAMDYNTGGAPTDLIGQALIQVSTGSIEEKNFPDDILEQLGRRTGAMAGSPPADQGTTIFTLPPGIKKDVHMIEK